MIGRLIFVFILSISCLVNADDDVLQIDGSTETEPPAWLNSRITVDFEDTPLVSALSLLARKSNFNIVTSPLDDSEITAHLKNITIKDALDAILNVSGFIYYIDGDIVIVKSLDDGAPGELVTKVFKLNYIDARQIEVQIQNMLSAHGKVQVISTGLASKSGGSAEFPAKIITVTDAAYMIPPIEELINKIDVKPRQVSIEVRLIETNLSNKETFGFDWQKSLQAKIIGADPGFESSDDGTLSDLSAFALHPYGGGNFTYGTLTISEAVLLLDFLKESGNSRLLSNPSVTTSDGKPARIEVATTIPIQTISRFTEAAVIQDIATYQYKDVGITLEVTPVVNDDGYIMLKCKLSVEEITGWVGPAESQQPITSKRTVTTDVFVKNGETLVIGGLIKENTIQTTKGIWLLSDIPVLGELFKSRSNTKNTTDLMILIKPTLLE